MDKTIFPPLVSEKSRPLYWERSLDLVEGCEAFTNTVTIFSEISNKVRFAGDNIAPVTLTREEIESILEKLDSGHCPFLPENTNITTD